MYKDANNKILYVRDPWKQKLDGKIWNNISQEATVNGYKMQFLKTNPDQGAEGICIATALLRAILSATYGYEGLIVPAPLEFIVLTSRLISMKR
jgi:hypothetical protein